MKLKDTLCLPRTAFPMKASLPSSEPERLRRWDAEGLASRVRGARKDRPKFILHDGPPYANGHVHIGTAINKVLKDFVLKSRMQAGFDVPYVPGWDCHGMPIEVAVLKQARLDYETLKPEQVRQRSREFADSFVTIQREEFRRLGVLGEWNDPYLTTDAAYEATIVAAFAELYTQGAIYRGLRSIHWCPTCRTALANAEVEHDPAHVSISIHVRFRLAADEVRAAALGLPADAAFLAWTTTPWTIPANVALALHPELEYALVGGDARNTIVATALLESVAKECGWKDSPVLARWKGSELEGLRARHPLFDRDSPVVLADYVTTEAGTGVVHTAPGHGAEDFETGRKYGLPILVPVDRAGRYTAEAGPFAGQQVFEANAGVVRALADAGALEHEGKVVHSYPTCWRCHGPLIFLATDQWFWNVDHDELRARCLEEIDRAEWTPAWGHDRMHDSVSVRPDWCLSRQRAWGVPIPAFECVACGKAVVSAASLARAVDVVREGGSDAWFSADVETLRTPDLECGSCGGTELVKDGNILDVWFDASCSHLAVLDSGRWPELSWPADLYVEAVDQHRGWFQVSLLNGVALKGKAPYKRVFTHGLILDEHGHKMSKSIGNVVKPEEVLAKHGADVLRLYFASVDCTSDIKFSMAALEPASDAYRKIRNTLRFLLGNLDGFDPSRDAVPRDEMTELDRHALDRLGEVSAAARQAHEDLVFHRVHRTLHGYLTTDVSAFFAHVLKDRLYCETADGHPRRSAQTALFEIARECCHLLAPILCFTAEEAWEHLPSWPGKPASVHEACWPPLVAADRERASAWSQIHEVREEVLKALEVARAASRIGDPLEASVTLCVPDSHHAAIASRLRTLTEALVVSDVRLEGGDAPVPELAHRCERLAGGWVLVECHGGRKCPRCWRYTVPGAGLPGFPDTCDRCAAVVTALGVELEPA